MWKFHLEEIIEKYGSGRTRKDKIEDIVSEFQKLLNDEKEKEDKENEQKRIVKDIGDLLNRWKADWTTNPYSDKLDTNTYYGKTAYEYEFENGDSFTLCDSELVVTTDVCKTTYTLGLIYRNIFIEFANTTINFNNLYHRQRPSKSYKSNNTGSTDKTSSNYFNKAFFESEKKNKYHHKWELYFTLVTTVNSRADQLKTCSENDVEVITNELEAAIRRMNEIKNKYQF